MVDECFRGSINHAEETDLFKKTMSDKDYDKYAYFVSKANNFAIVIKPTKKKIVDGEVVFEEGLRLDFHNKMLRLEKTKENERIIAKLREKLESEKALDPKRRSFFEETKPKEMVEMDKVETLLEEKIGEKNDKIAELEAELAKLKKQPEDKKNK